ncbi:CD209 antigen-like protein E [Lepisosteus oculatus]
MSSNLKKFESQLQAQDTQISSALTNWDSRFLTHESQVSSSLNSLSSQLQAQGCTKVCPCDWILFSGSCYYFSKESKDWHRAQQYCVNQASSLAIINNVDELKILSSKISSGYWVGLNDLDSEGRWKWVDRTPVDMSDKYWNAGEPNNVGEEDCGELTNGKINDRMCRSAIPWICEKSI